MSDAPAMNFDADLTLDELAHQAVGAASMCWENVEGAGVFDEEQARFVANGLLVRMNSKMYDLATALRLTQEYIGSDALPPLPGWSWWDALTAHYGEPFVPADRRGRPIQDEVPTEPPDDESPADTQPADEREVQK